MKYIRTKYEGILETQTTSKCIYVIRNKNVDGKNCYVTYLWDNWKNYHLIDFQNCVLFSYNSAQNFISDLMKENLNYQDLVIEISPYYKNCKQSETIEELCDEFVCEWFDKKVNRDRHKYCSFKIGQRKELYRRDIPLSANVDFEIYAGIWVKNKGLIYVAKTNEKGELELI